MNTSVMELFAVAMKVSILRMSQMVSPKVNNKAFMYHVCAMQHC